MIPKTGRHGGINIPNQNGYILVFTVVLLFALLLTSVNYFSRSGGNLQISSYNRDASESLILAESAMNTLFGQFIYDGDLNGDGTPDKLQKIDFKNVEKLPLSYLYYTSAGAGIDQALPSILQKVANGEARNSGGSVSHHSVAASQTNLLIENLQTASANPVVFTLDSNDKLVPDSASSWSAVKNKPQAAAAWLELVRNPELAGGVQVYVQAVGKVGKSKSYVQRLIGNYPTTVGRKLAGLNESSL